MTIDSLYGVGGGTQGLQGPIGTLGQPGDRGQKSLEDVLGQGFVPSRKYEEEFQGSFKDILRQLARQYRKLERDQYDLSIETAELAGKLKDCEDAQVANQSFMQQIENTIALLKEHGVV